MQRKLTFEELVKFGQSHNYTIKEFDSVSTLSQGVYVGILMVILVLGVVVILLIRSLMKFLIILV